MKPVIFAPAGSLTDFSVEKLESEGYIVIESHGDKIPKLEIGGLRDEFAMSALPAVIATQNEAAKAGHASFLGTETAAKAAYELADAMILERSK